MRIHTPVEHKSYLVSSDGYTGVGGGGDDDGDVTDCLMIYE